MKTLLSVIITLLLLVTPAFADEVTEPIILAFTQGTIDQVDGWYIHMATASDGPYVKVQSADGQVIKFAKQGSTQNTAGEWLVNQAFVVTGDPNTTSTRWFKISAYGMDQNEQEVESGLSNPASYDFTFPLSMKVPVLIRVRSAEE